MVGLIHTGRDGVRKPCVAEDRKGLGVTDCPNFIGKFYDLHSLALEGGGPVRISGRDLIISGVDRETGLWTQSDGKGRMTAFSAVDGEKVPWQQRRGVTLQRALIAEQKFAGPSSYIIDLYAEEGDTNILVEQMKEWNATWGVNITNYNKRHMSRFINVFVEVAKRKRLDPVRAVELRSQALWNLMVDKHDPETAIKDALFLNGYVGPSSDQTVKPTRIGQVPKNVAESDPVKPEVIAEVRKPKAVKAKEKYVPKQKTKLELPVPIINVLRGDKKPGSLTKNSAKDILKLSDLRKMVKEESFADRADLVRKYIGLNDPDNEISPVIIRGSKLMRSKLSREFKAGDDTELVKKYGVGKEEFVQLRSND